MNLPSAARARAAAVACAFVCLLLGFSMPGRAAADEPPAPVQSAPQSVTVPDISLLTFGPGEIYWERFGHNAILVRSGDSDEDAIAYNYGLFDFRQKNFMLNFVRGYMTYRMAADSVYLDLRMYEDEGRWTTIQHLALTPAQRIALRDYLEWNARPENTRYRYDYFRSNCSTRVRDALDRALGGALRRQLEGRMTTATYRSEAVRLISPDRWMGTAMDIALGPDADRPLDLWQQSFVPMVLMEALRGVKVVGPDGSLHPLVDDERRILPGRLAPAPAAAPDLRVPAAIAGIGFAAALLMLVRLSRRRAARLALSVLASTFTLVCGIGGLILAVLWGFTQHWAGWHNENLLLLNPLCLFLLPAWIGRARRNPRPRVSTPFLAATIALLAAAAPGLKLFPALEQANASWILLLFPIHLALAFVARRRNATS
jgi:hypothetical protein